jgi:hypothetical protein
LVSSSRIRSAETISRVVAISVIAAEYFGRGHDPELGDEARRPHHPQRVVAEGHLGGAGRAQGAVE